MKNNVVGAQSPRDKGGIKDKGILTKFIAGKNFQQIK
jgi:hypothetical protein